jgi:hypothetical protein
MGIFHCSQFLQKIPVLSIGLQFRSSPVKVRTTFFYPNCHLENFIGGKMVRHLTPPFYNDYSVFIIRSAAYKIESSSQPRFSLNHKPQLKPAPAI